MLWIELNMWWLNVKWGIGVLFKIASWKMTMNSEVTNQALWQLNWSEKSTMKIFQRRWINNKILGVSELFVLIEHLSAINPNKYYQTFKIIAI